VTSVVRHSFRVPAGDVASCGSGAKRRIPVESIVATSLPRKAPLETFLSPCWPDSAGLSIATMRLKFIPSLLVVSNLTDDQIAMLSTGSFALSFIIHACVAEVWIRATRTKTMTPIQPANSHDLLHR
jgi:hypothetical protein